MKVWIVDAFTKVPYAGNPAGVMIVDQFPEDKICKKIAAEINLSETAFVKHLDDNRFHLRWFTPTIEVKLCGHATLASAHILYQEKFLIDPSIQFETLSGTLTVHRNELGLTLDFPLQQTGPHLDKNYFEEIIGNSVIEAVQAMDCVIVELTDEIDLRTLSLLPEKILSIDCRGLIVTVKGKEKYDFVSRYFAPRVGINEDPVTGSAHCKLADYWQRKLNKNKFIAYQASQRGGELLLEINGSRLYITGDAVTVMKGNWII